MPFINTAPQQQPKEDKYRYVEEILSAPDYYKVLGIKKDAPPEEVRRAYIKVRRKDRICFFIWGKRILNHENREVEFVTQINLYQRILEQLRVFNVSW
jgi:hypothetical protein